MTDIRLVGVSSRIALHDVQDMGGPAAQDVFIAECAKDLSEKLREYVADAQPRSDFSFQVTGPHPDSIQGAVYVHTFSCHFDMDAMNENAGALRAYRDGATEPTLGSSPIVIQGHRS